MAKGDPSGRYVAQQVYTFEDVNRELMRIAAAFEIARAGSVEFLNVEPVRLREGMVAGADGTNWNPGSGQGVYVYYNSAWNKLG